MTKPQPLDLEEVKQKIWKRLEKEWDNAIEKYNKERIIVNFPFDDEEEIVKLAIKRTIKEIKRRLKQACEFYLRYKDKPELFSKEQFKIEHNIHTPDNQIIIFHKNFWIDYNDWLFKLAFKDVLEEK